MLENWPRWIPGLVGGLAAAVLVVWAGAQKPKARNGQLILDYPPLNAAILIFAAIGLPPLAVFAVHDFASMAMSGGASFRTLAGKALVAGICSMCAIASITTAYGIIFERVSFNAEGFAQERSFPRWSRTVLWQDVERAGYIDLLQLHWLKPKEGPKFWYFDGMRGLDQFNSFLMAGQRAHSQT
jgi:hypothetical protein